MSRIVPRIPNLSPEKLSPEQRKVYDTIASGPRGHVRGPLAVWLQSAPLAARAEALGAFCRYDTSLPKRLSELAIIITGAKWRAGFEWYVHAPLGIKEGLDPDAVEAIRTGGTPTFMREDEAALYAFTHELLETHEVSDATYKRAEAQFGTVGLVELVGILGYYGLISMTIKAFRVAVPEGEQEPFEK